ncbi:Sulfatase [Macrophomina phaseolina MS6]|uniref:Sulfatase n=1 Tax=Macrophomina phaseolina (strain MS6) TaxID=1126212 RepID=K2SD63_MACPH|nr:Sulfatase [Macrophomina phaseolina MS6]
MGAPIKISPRRRDKLSDVPASSERIEGLQARLKEPPYPRLYVTQFLKMFPTSSLLSAGVVLLLFTPIRHVSATEQEQTSARRPNFLFIMSDDQDKRMGSLDYQPLLDKHIRQHGTEFRSHYCTVAQCCPSRASLWTGKAAHNTNVTDTRPPYGYSWSSLMYTCEIIKC